MLTSVLEPQVLVWYMQLMSTSEIFKTIYGSRASHCKKAWAHTVSRSHLSLVASLLNTSFEVELQPQPRKSGTPLRIERHPNEASTSCLVDLVVE